MRPSRIVVASVLLVFALAQATAADGVRALPQDDSQVALQQRAEARYLAGDLEAAMATYERAIEHGDPYAIPTALLDGWHAAADNLANQYENARRYADAIRVRLALLQRLDGHLRDVYIQHRELSLDYEEIGDLAQSEVHRFAAERLRGLDDDDDE